MVCKRRSRRKRGLERRPDGQTGHDDPQHFLHGYPRICGMTGTAQTAAEELKEMHGADVVVVPTHRPVIRADQPDVVFTHRDAKDRAVVEERFSGRIQRAGPCSLER